MFLRASGRESEGQTKGSGPLVFHLANSKERAVRQGQATHIELFTLFLGGMLERDVDVPATLVVLPKRDDNEKTHQPQRAGVNVQG